MLSGQKSPPVMPVLTLVSTPPPSSERAEPTFPAAFPYGDLEPAAATVALAAAEAIRDIQKRTIPEVGHHLLLAKAALPHGAFTSWAKSELGIEARSARNYMAAAEWLVGKPASVAALPPTVLYALAAPNAPPELVLSVVTGAEAGAAIDVPTIRSSLDAAKYEQAELRLARRRSPGLTALTASELRARKARQRKEAEAQHAKAEAKREQEHQNRLDKLRPLAHRLSGLGAAAVAELLQVLSHTRTSTHWRICCGK